MNRTEKVNIGGYEFTIDEAAGKAAQSYLSSIEELFAESPDRQEILAGIEDRLGELLLQMTSRRDVITPANISEAIKTIGSPEQIKASLDMDGSSSPEAGNMKRSLKDIWKRVKSGKVWSSLRSGAGVLLLLLGLVWFVVSILVFSGSNSWALRGIRMLKGYVLRDLATSSHQLVALVQLWWIRALAGVLCFIPVFIFAYLGAKAILRFRTPSWKPGLTMFIVWIILLILSMLLLLLLLMGGYSDLTIFVPAQDIPFKI